MQIIEQALVPKSPAKKCEDGIVVTPDFIAVIDGSTSKASHQHSFFRSNGRYAMQLTARYITHMPKTTTCHQFCTGVTAYIHKHYRRALLPLLASHPEERLTASAIIFSRLCREIWLIGDCHCLVTPLPPLSSHPSQPSHSSHPSHLPSPPPPPLSGGPAYVPASSPSPSSYYDNPKPYEQELAERRAAIIASSPKPHDHFLDNDTARQAIIPRMLETMQNQNRTYAVIDGFPIAEQHVRIVTLDFQPWEIVLASDGYPFLCPTLDESEARLAHQRATDPLNIGTFKATKAFARGNNSFDDRAYIRFRV